ncbi:MAG: aminopeptidase P family protein [Alphaproteobacteria bacterium]|nr:MAG: aminopeptidase P family protein [Alphaproteobacteria bacterium]
MTAQAIPFDHARLDRLMDEAGIDVLLATSKHNVQYLLGGHRSIFFDYMDAMGLSRYLPIVVYPKGKPDKAAYFGHRLEGFQKEVKPFWTPEAQTNSSGALDTMGKATDYLRRSGIPNKRIGIETTFMPMDAGAALKSAMPGSEIKDALVVLERQRLRKSPQELAMLKTSSEKVIDAMLAAIAQHGPGSTKAEITETLRREEVNRGLTFEYCLIAAGASHNRAPSPQRWEEGDVLSVDSGANYHGYIGDLARMAILGEPDAELEDMLGEIETIQRAAFKPIRAGAMGGEIYAAGEALVAKSKQHNNMEFLAHGMGLVSHEAPHLTNSGPVPYTDEDAHRPLEAGMVISVETTLKHPARGFIKLEDTIAVTDTGFEIFGEGGRGWNRGGTAAMR